MSKPARQAIRFSWVLPLFMSAVFFISGLFAVIAPFPLIALHYARGRSFALLAAASNLVIVGVLSGVETALLFAVFTLSISLLLPEFLNKMKRVEWAGFLTLLVVAFLVLGSIVVSKKYYHLNLMAEFKAQVSTFATDLGQTQMQDEPEVAQFRDKVVSELPSALAIAVLLSVWANLLLLLRFNPGNVKERIGIDPAFFLNWKAPYWLVWPTIALGFCLVFEVGLSHAGAMNFFKFIMAIYVIQGFGILAFFFEKYKIMGFFRTFLFTFLVVFMLPLVLGLGFFDQWFDFRAKFGQS